VHRRLLRAGIAEGIFPNLEQAASLTLRRFQFIAYYFYGGGRGNAFDLLLHPFKAASVAAMPSPR
jgi:hypothetical protein